MAGPDYNMLLGTSQPDFIGIRDRAAMAAQREIDSQNQNALTKYIRDNGAGIMAGDRNALAGYAQFDPAAALNIQGAQQDMAQSRERFAMQKAEIARQTQAELEAKKSEIDRKALEAEQKRMSDALMGAHTFYTRGDRAGYQKFVESLGLDPSQFSFDNHESNAAQIEGVLDGISAFNKVFGGPEWVDLTPEEAVARGFSSGQRNSMTGRIEGVKLPASRTETIYGTGGQPILTRTTGGPGGGATAGDILAGSVQSPGTYTGEIDAILNDPALPRVTGPLEGSGGNDIGQMSFWRRSYHTAKDAYANDGGDSMALIERIGNLQNKTWLAARQMLKGGGAITDYESRKAEGAMARLERAKSTEEMRAALVDLRDAISDGERKLREAGLWDANAPQAGAPPVAGGGGQAAERLRFNPATGGFE